jgi:hypothetical protein
MDVTTSIGMNQKKPYKQLKYKTVEEVQKAVYSYYAECKDKNEELTITGLAMRLGTTRANLLSYDKDSKLYKPIEKALARMEKSLELKAIDKPELIKILEKNFGW